MKKIVLKTLSVILGIIIITSLLPSAAKASDLLVEFESNPLFEEANFLPGDSVTRWVKVTNNSAEDKKVLTQATDYSDPIPSDDLCHALMITISQNDVDLYGGSSATGPKTLCDFYQESKNLPIYLSDIHSGETIQYDFSILFNSDSNNEWQEKTTYFDIVIGFETKEEGQEGENEDNGGSETPGEVSGSSYGGGGGYSGLIIFNEENVEVETDRVVLTWFTNYPATSRVIYDTVSHSTIGAPPNYGYAFSTPEDSNKATFHRVTLTGLTPGVTYYWRAISHGSPEIWGKELSFTIPIKDEEKPASGENGETTTMSETEGGDIASGIAKGNVSKGSGSDTGNKAGTEEGNQLTGEERGMPQGGEDKTTSQNAEEQSSKEEARKKGFVNWLSSGLASLFDIFNKFFGNLSIYHFVILILILIIFYLIYLLYKKEKEKEKSKPINLGPPSSSSQ